MAFPGSSMPDGSDKGTKGAGRLQDTEWLSSLSDSELDFLISLKELAARRAKNAGYKDIGDKFDLRMLRALGFVLLEFFKERVQNTSKVADSAEILRSLNQCCLSFLNCEGKSDSSAEPTDPLAFVTPRRKRMWDGLCEETTKRHKRQKTEDVHR